MPIYLITLLNVLNGISLRGSRVVLALFAIHLGSDAFEVGILISVSSVLQLFLGIYAGQISDRHGFRLPMLFGSLGSAIAMLVPYVYPHLSSLYASRVLTGVAFIFLPWPSRISPPPSMALKCARATSARSVSASRFRDCWGR